METAERPEIGIEVRHANGKALAGLIFGIFAVANVVALGLIIWIQPSALDNSNGWWLLMPLFGFSAGIVGAFFGAIGWIDVRRGVTDRHLTAAKIGALLGGTAAIMTAAAVSIAIIWLMLAFEALNRAG